MGRAAAIRALLTAGLPGSGERRGLCGRCRGTGFDAFEKHRAGRRCPACKGAGAVIVGSTKR